MKSTARIGGHPIHPMLIPFPFAFLTGAAAFDVLAASRQNEELGTTARHIGMAGLITAGIAAIPGIVDYATTVPAGRPRQTATAHMLSNVSALALFVAAARARTRTALPSRTAIALGLIGTAALAVGGWLGGSLSYHHRIGVDESSDTASRRLRAGDPAIDRTIAGSLDH